MKENENNTSGNNKTDELESCNKLDDALQPYIEQQAKLQDVINRTKINLPNVATEQTAANLQGLRLKQPSGLYLAARSISGIIEKSLVNYDFTSISHVISDALRLLIENSISSMAASLSKSIVPSPESPIIKLLEAVKQAPFLRAISDLNLDESVKKHSREVNIAYLSALYKSKWFPYVGIIADYNLIGELASIIASSRGISKRCEKRIDTVILSHYTNSQILKLKKEWNSYPIEHHVKRALGQSLSAYMRGEYALTLPCLATMWEGMIKDKANGINKPQNAFQQLIENNGLQDILSDFYSNMIMNTCYSKDDVIAGVPNRHGIAHSWYSGYPSKKAALNAILMTDCLIKLTPLNV